jgi:hypothetical protein
MNNPRNSQVNVLLIVLSLLAVLGGLAIVFVTSPQSLQLSQYGILPERPTEPVTPTPAPTAAATATASATAIPSATPFTPSATATSTPRPTSTQTAGPSATLSTADLTNVALPPDVRALAVVNPLSNSQTARVRDLPNGEKLVAAVAGGTRLQVLYGDVIIDDVEWLEVRLSSLQTGWISRSLVTFTFERPPGTGGPPASESTSTPVP